MPLTVHTPITPGPVVAPVPEQQASDVIRTETQNAIRDAVREVARARQEVVIAQGGGVAAPQATLDVLRSQIDAEKATIERLTAQIEGASGPRIGVITDQIEQSQERLSSLQQQMDRALGLTQQETIEFPPPFPREDIIPQQAVDITFGFFITVAVIAIGVPLARAFARRMDRKGASAPAPSASEPRLERIEQAIEAIAIEVERVSEGQRYATKLMSEMRALPAPNAMEQWPQAAPKAAVPVESRAER